MDTNLSDFEIKNETLTKYNGNSETVSIPEGIKYIEDYAFKNAFEIKTLIIPPSVEYFGRAFIRDVAGYKYSLEEIRVNDIHDWLKINFYRDFNPLEIAKKLVVNGETVKNLELPNDIDCIKFGAFKNLNTLETLTIKDNIKYIEEKSFRECLHLKKISIPGSVKHIGLRKDYLSYSSLAGAFLNCRELEEVNLAEGVEIIGEGTFSGCESLKEIKLPQSLQIIKENAFSDSGLERIIIPSNVKIIERNALTNCKNLKEVIFEGESIELGNNCFAGCKNLKNIVVPNMEKNCSALFLGCSNLEYNEYDNGEYIGTKDNEYYLFVKPKRNDIENCIIHKNCIHILDRGFYKCTNLKKIIIPANVKDIGDECFENCTSLTKVVYEGTTLLGKDVFKGCKSLKSSSMSNQIIQIEQNNEIVVLAHSTYYKLEIFNNCYNKETVYFKVYNGCDNMYTYQNRVVNLKIYAYLLKNGYSTPKGTENEIKIKFIPDFIGDDLYSDSIEDIHEITYKDLKMLDRNNYVYLKVDNDEIKALLGYFTGENSFLTNSIKIGNLEYEIDSYFTKSILDKYSTYSSKEIASMYYEAISRGDLVTIEEITIINNMDDQSKEEISNLSIDSSDNTAQNSSEKTGFSDDDLPF